MKVNITRDEKKYPPVPKLSSPQIEHSPASIKFPKNFHPVGTWHNIKKIYEDIMSRI